MLAFETAALSIKKKEKQKPPQKSKKSNCLDVEIPAREILQETFDEEEKEPNSDFKSLQLPEVLTQNSADTSAMANEEPYSLVGKCFAEFIAVMIFVIIGSFQALTEFDGVLHAALAHGIAIFVLVSCFAHISGGHVNPAVTFGIALAGKIKWLEAGLYIVAQLLGGLVGSLLVRLWLTRESYVSIQGGATLCAANVTMFQGCAVEIATTFCLVQTVLLTAVDSATVLAPLAIGLTVAMDIFAVGGISGASMNPGRSFGPNVVATIFMHEELAENFWSHHWIYYVGPICGAALASGLYRLFFAKSGRMV